MTVKVVQIAAVVFGFVLQTGALAWWMASLDHRVAEQGRRISDASVAVTALTVASTAGTVLAAKNDWRLDNLERTTIEMSRRIAENEKRLGIAAPIR